VFVASNNSGACRGGVHDREGRVEPVQEFLDIPAVVVVHQ